MCECWKTNCDLRDAGTTTPNTNKQTSWWEQGRVRWVTTSQQENKKRGGNRGRTVWRCALKASISHDFCNFWIVFLLLFINLNGFRSSFGLSRDIPVEQKKKKSCLLFPVDIVPTFLQSDRPPPHTAILRSSARGGGRRGPRLSRYLIICTSFATSKGDFHCFSHLKTKTKEKQKENKI